MYPDSLVAKILKANYFPADNFLQAKMGSQPSYVWRLILKGRDLLEKGLR